MPRRYTVIFEQEEEGDYHVFCPTLPGCHTQSENIEDGIACAEAPQPNCSLVDVP